MEHYLIVTPASPLSHYGSTGEDFGLTELPVPDYLLDAKDSTAKPMEVREIPDCLTADKSRGNERQFAIHESFSSLRTGSFCTKHCHTTDQATLNSTSVDNSEHMTDAPRDCSSETAHAYNDVVVSGTRATTEDAQPEGRVVSHGMVRKRKPQRYDYSVAAVLDDLDDYEICYSVLSSQELPRKSLCEMNNVQTADSLYIMEMEKKTNNADIWKWKEKEKEAIIILNKRIEMYKDNQKTLKFKKNNGENYYSAMERSLLTPMEDSFMGWLK
ncbi:hypothetical protein HDV02_004071 [Globomyces sp. JEL0801]|nr:hypothetical protein HDV02_004071 [Globomyces sp. JEL0801]